MYPKTMEFDTLRRVEGGSKEQLRKALSGRRTDVLRVTRELELSHERKVLLFPSQSSGKGQQQGWGSVAGHCYSEPGRWTSQTGIREVMELGDHSL